MDQLVEIDGTAARGDREAAVFREGAGIDELVDVFAGGALVGTTAPRHCIGSSFVGEDGLPLQNLGKVGTDFVEIDLAFDRNSRAALFARLNEDQWMAFVDRIAGCDVDHAYDAAGDRLDDVLHLHGFHDEHLLADADRVAFPDIQ